MVDIDLETSNEHRKPRVIIQSNYDYMEEAEELRIKLKKAMEVIKDEL